MSLDARTATRAIRRDDSVQLRNARSLNRVRTSAFGSSISSGSGRGYAVWAFVIDGAMRGTAGGGESVRRGVVVRVVLPVIARVVVRIAFDVDAVQHGAEEPGVRVLELIERRLGRLPAGGIGGND